MVKVFWDLFVKRIRKTRTDAVGQVNHEAVISGVFQEVEITSGYFFVLSLANLIALTGLLANSAPVIIGAMLISPLMGPILSTGFAFVTGNRVIWRKALGKISLSVALTLVVAAAASYLSPLQEVTAEIAARTRPNLYDLLIAIFAGLAGAIAICTKKNFITIVPGVAIATAVIPPLSVAGFGIGTGNFSILAGGFFLFFTNFVAIIISTCAVLFFYGFTPYSDSGLEKAALRKRTVFLVSVLFVICIPLIYTLRQSVATLALNKKISATLKSQLDRPAVSHLSTFTYQEKSDKSIEINAIINTIRYLSEKEISSAEKVVEATLGRQVAFHLEQIRVQPGGLKEEAAFKPAVTSLAAGKQRLPEERVLDARTNLQQVFSGVTEKIDAYLSPSMVKSFTVGIPNQGLSINLALVVQRDYPLTDDELRLLRRVASGEAGVPVRMEVETVPFVPPLVFPDQSVDVSEEMKRSLLAARQVFERDPDMSVLVESRVESPSRLRKNRLYATDRAGSVALYLKETCGVPPDRIRTRTSPPAKDGRPTVVVSILPARNIRH